MNVSLQNIDKVSAELTVKLEKADYQEKVDKELKSLRQKAQIPGFRKGMVPTSLIKKMYGKSVIAEVVNKALQEAVYNYIKDNKVNMLGEPLPNEEKQQNIDFDTMEEYKKDLTEKLQAEKIEAAKTADEDKVVAKVIENATMEIPDQMVEEQVNGMVNDYARRLESQGISFKQYVEITGMTAEKIGEQMKPQAIKRIQTRLVLEAVVKAENIQADDAAVEEQFDKMAEDFKMDKEQIKGMFGEEQMAQLKEDLAVQKAIDFLVAEAKFVD